MEMSDLLRDKMGSGVLVLGGLQDGKPTLIASVTEDLADKVHAGRLVQAVAKRMDGGGGGKATMARAGGGDPAKMEAALAAACEDVGRMARGE